jgi:hypothetical protein
MIVAELLSTTETLSQYTKRLVKTLGIPMIGRGVFSGVFMHPVYHNVVVKVFDDRDIEYQKFLRFVMKNQGNRWLPRVIDHVKVNGPKGRLHIVFMEKLTPLRHHSKLLRKFAKELNRLVPGMKDDILDALENKDYSFSKDGWRKIAMAAARAGHDIEPVARFLATNANNLDLHWDNIMGRGSDQAVITDPVAGNPAPMRGEKIGEEKWI